MADVTEAARKLVEQGYTQEQAYAIAQREAARSPAQQRLEESINARPMPPGTQGARTKPYSQSSGLMGVRG